MVFNSCVQFFLPISILSRAVFNRLWSGLRKVDWPKFLIGYLLFVCFVFYFIFAFYYSSTMIPTWAMAPRGFFLKNWRGVPVTVIWAFPRFGHAPFPNP